MLNIPEEVKDLFKRNSVRKNIRIHFPNGEREDITNSNLLAESFSFTESVMSQAEFRFGLCEASMVEFECFGVENIKGYEIEVSHEIDISSLEEEFISEYGTTSDDVAFPFYRVLYGRFTVDESLRQSDMVRRKVTAYGKMIQDLKPNRFEIMKGRIPYANKGMYTIDLFKYLYSNVSGNSVIPNAIYTEMNYGTLIIGDSLNYNGYSLRTEYTRLSIRKNDILKISLGEKIKTIDKAYLEILEYTDENIKELSPSIKETMNYNVLVHSDNVAIVTGNVEYSSRREVIDTEENPFYIYSGLRFESSSDFDYIVVNIYFSLSLVDGNNNIVRKVDLRNKSQTKIYQIEMVGPQILYSYPFQKGKYGYYIKDIPYDQLSKDIEEAIELQGKFGKVDRYGNFQMISVNGNFGLYPSEDLYPSETLYPKDPSGGILTKGNYLSAWYDDEYTKPYDRVSVSYKNADEEEMYAEYLLVDIESDTYNANDYQVYSLSENSLIQNGTFTEAEITEILQTVGEALRNIRYMPCDIDAIGMPWVEAGDGLSVLTRDGGFETLVLNRRIDGIQSLKDNITAD